MKKIIIRNLIEIDAAGKAVGRVAAQIAKILQGKNKAAYVPNLDEGDKILLKNASKVLFTGRKLEQKDYKHHSMYPGGLKVRSMKKVFDKNPAEVMRHAVYGMLPKNRRRDEFMKRLTIEV